MGMLGNLEISGGGGNNSGTNTGDQMVFKTISVSGQSDVVADSTADTLTMVAGSNITITTDATTDTITFTGSAGVSTHSILDSAVHTDSVTQTVSRGSLIYGNSTPKWDELVIGAANRVLRSDGTDAAWSQVALATDISGDLPFANLTQGSALSVLGVTGNSTADFASIAAASDHQVLRRSGTALTFGAVNLAQSAAVTGRLAYANIVAATAARLLGASAAGDWGEIVLGTNLSFSGSTLNAASGTNNPGGTTGDIQFYTAGAFDAEAALNWNKTTNTLSADGPAIFNDSGAAVNFRVEGDTDANLLFADGTNDRVGVGTSSPSTKLHLVGVLHQDGVGTGIIDLGLSIRTANRAEFFLHSSGDNATTFFLGRDARTDANEKWLISARPSGELDGLFFYEGPYNTGAGFLERFVLAKGGNVGVGTITPDARLTVAADGTFADGNSGTLRIQGATSSTKRLNLGFDTTSNYGWIESVIVGTAIQNLCLQPRNGGNIGLGGTTFGTSAVGAVGIYNGTEPSSSPADMVQFYSVDISAGNASLGVRTEATVQTAVTASDRYLNIRVNGTTYKLLLAT